MLSNLKPREREREARTAAYGAKKKKNSLNIFHKGAMNLCGSPRGAQRRRSLLAPESARLHCAAAEFCPPHRPPFSAGAHRGKTGVPVSHVNNEFLI